MKKNFLLTLLAALLIIVACPAWADDEYDGSDSGQSDGAWGWNPPGHGGGSDGIAGGDIGPGGGGGWGPGGGGRGGGGLFGGGGSRFAGLGGGGILQKLVQLLKMLLLGKSTPMSSTLQGMGNLMGGAGSSGGCNGGSCNGGGGGCPGGRCPGNGGGNGGGCPGGRCPGNDGFGGGGSGGGDGIFEEQSGTALDANIF